jgi:hypothetical protein
MVTATVIALIIIAIGVLCHCSGPYKMVLYHPPAQHDDSVWLASDTTTATAPHALYVLTVACQLNGMQVYDSVTHWATVGDCLRIDRWKKPGPIPVCGEYRIVDIQERH